MIRRRNLLILGIALIVAYCVLAFVLDKVNINFLYITLPVGLFGFWLLMWGIFGRDFRGYPKALKARTQN